MLGKDYLNLQNKISLSDDNKFKKKYSVTGDILQFQLCPRQYGFFNVRGYHPSNLTQFWFGTIIHQVLDKLHLQYLGRLDPQKKGQTPSDDDVKVYFDQIMESLRTKGIRAINENEKKLALKLIMIFNSVEGPTLYKNVEDTECSLQDDVGDFILHGKVDLIKDVSVGKEINGYNSVEIWDYKGSTFPDVSSEDGKNRLNQYTSQMLAYAHLYYLREGKYPLKCVLYFLNELNTDPEPTSRPTQAIYEIDIRNPIFKDAIDKTLKDFSEVVEKIEKYKEIDEWKVIVKPDKKTCDICNLRWDCNKVKYPMRYP
jgi:putative RecB family exonuclease